MDPTLQVATILIAMAPFEAGNFICKKVSLNQKNWSPSGNQAKTLTLRVGTIDILE